MLLESRSVRTSGHMLVCTHKRRARLFRLRSSHHDHSAERNARQNARYNAMQRE